MATGDVRATLLAILSERHAKDLVFDEGSVLKEAYRRLDARDRDVQWAILDDWQDLYRSGVVSWGLNLESEANWSAPWVRLTARGRTTIENISRDPSNPRAYLAALDPILPTGTVARSYAEEAVQTYAAGCDKATAVLIGGASEALVIGLRDVLVVRMDGLKKNVSKKLKDWKTKMLAEGIEEELRLVRKQIPPALYERFEAFWAPFVGHLRMVRNEAGHPQSVDPVTRDTVHSLLLIFPEQARLAVDLTKWVQSSYA